MITSAKQILFVKNQNCDQNITHRSSIKLNDNISKNLQQQKNIHSSLFLKGFFKVSSQSLMKSIDAHSSVESIDQKNSLSQQNILQDTPNKFRSISRDKMEFWTNKSDLKNLEILSNDLDLKNTSYLNSSNKKIIKLKVKNLRLDNYNRSMTQDQNIKQLEHKIKSCANIDQFSLSKSQIDNNHIKNDSYKTPQKIIKENLSQINVQQDQSQISQDINEQIFNELVQESINDFLFIQNKKQVNNKVAQNIDKQLSDSLLDDQLKSSLENSSQETIYAIRTHFIALQEYAQILEKYFSQNKFKNLKNLLQKNLKQDFFIEVVKNKQYSEEEYLQIYKDKLLDQSIVDKHFNLIENEILKNCQNIHNLENLLIIQKSYHRSIYECLLENILETSFDFFKLNLQYDFFIQKFSQFQNWQILLLKSIDKVLESAGFLCGVIRDKEDSMIGDLKFIDNYTLFSLREERMMRMILYTMITQMNDIERQSYMKNNMYMEICNEIQQELIDDVCHNFLIQLIFKIMQNFFYQKCFQTNKILRKKNTTHWNQLLDQIEQLHAGFNILKKQKISTKIQNLEILKKLTKKNEQNFVAAISDDMGKVTKESQLEFDKTMSHFDQFIQNGEKYLSMKTWKEDTNIIKQFPEPIGIIYKITPFNFPLWIAMKSAIPNLLLGNSMAVKITENCLNTAEVMEQTFKDFNPEFAQVLYPNRDESMKIIKHGYVQGVSFTGGEKGGQIVAQTAAQYLKKTVLELGGSDPCIIGRTKDNQENIKKFVKGRLMNMGQICSSPKRVIVMDYLKEQFTEIVRNELSKIQDVPYLIDQDATQKVLEQVENALEEGDRLLYGQIEKCKSQKKMYPLFVSCKKNSVLFDEEIFGPVIAVRFTSSLDEAVKIANNTRFGLGSTIFYHDTKKAEQMAQQIQAGQVSINNVCTSNTALPWGGIKNSGYGVESGQQGMEYFANIKTIIQPVSKQNKFYY